MTQATIAVIAVLVFAWAVLSGAATRRNVTGPMVFAVVGFVLANPDWGVLHVDIDTSTVHGLVEVTLALLLFSDAARVNARELRRDLGLPVRLLGIGLPLSVLAGAGLAVGLLRDLPWALAGFLGASLAPTDAALSAPVISDERLPLRLRRALNVESGLNDGIATPIVTVMLAVAATQLGLAASTDGHAAGSPLRDLAVGIAIGAVGGAGGAWVLTTASRHGWVAHGGRRLAALAIGLAAFSLAVAIDGNGFIAAFVAGIAFGATVDETAVPLDTTMELPELGGDVLALVVWFLFGATLLPLAFGHLDPAIVVYAVLSLTVVRMVPVGLCLIRSGLDPPSVAFVAWFGPRGLATVVFALLAIEELGDTAPETQRVLATVALTVALSVVLHGISAIPGARSYLRHEQHPSTDGPRARRAAGGALASRGTAPAPRPADGADGATPPAPPPAG